MFRLLRRAALLAAACLILGGPALFLIGHAAFKAVIWRRLSWRRVVAVAIADQIWRPAAQQHPSAAATGPVG